MTKLSELKGLGPKSESYLKEIGITTREQLEEIGAVGAFIELKKKNGINLSLNFLYAMVGALEGKHWADIAKSEKVRLLFELEDYKELEKILEPELTAEEQLNRRNENSNLQAIPGIGKSLGKDLTDLGYKKIKELKNEDPEVMYQNLMELRGHHIDRCVLYVFRCAVYYASNLVHDPELLKWWNRKDK